MQSQDEEPRGLFPTSRIAVDVGFTEGPVIAQDGWLWFVSLDQRCIYRVRPSGADLERIADVGGGPNGLAELADGSFVIAQNSGFPPGAGLDGTGSGAQFLHPDGTFGWLSEEMVAPNDICVGPDGYVYLTDPTRKHERDDGRIWRLDVQTGDAAMLAHVPWYPNGLGFGLQDDGLYVADTRNARIVTMPLQGDRLGPEETLFDMGPLRPDGFAFDVDGNILVGAISLADGAIGEVQHWSAEGEQLDRLELGPGRFYTNFALGSDGTLFVTASDEGAVLRSDDWSPAGLALHPFRH